MCCCLKLASVAQRCVCSLLINLCCSFLLAAVVLFMSTFCLISFFLEISANRLIILSSMLDISLNCLSLLCTSEQYESSVGNIIFCLFVYR